MARALVLGAWALLLALPQGAAGHYGKPPCAADEVEAKVQGATSRALCAPECGAQSACPADVPGGAAARPQCLLQDAHSAKKYCGLVCTSDGQCPAGAACSKVAIFLGVCTYPASNTTSANAAALGMDLEQPVSDWPVEPLSGAELRKPALTQKLIAAVAAAEGSTWTAGMNRRFEGLSLAEAKVQMGALLGGPRLQKRAAPAVANGTLPDNFDWREKMGEKCPSITEVRDQSTCGSCWAFGAVEAMTDRICIQSKGAVQHELSAQDPVSCCGIICGRGCQGGYPAAAWGYFSGRGIVTGGKYGDHSLCYSYQMPECAHHSVDPKHPNCSAAQATPTCRASCEDGEGWRSAKLHNRAGAAYHVDGEAALRQEIYNKGPVTGMFMVFNDFLAYKSGVYQYTHGGFLGGHAIEIVGWGSQPGPLGGTPYWWVKNSWNAEWGDRGFFKIVRGTDLVRKVRNGGIDSGLLNGGPVAGDVRVDRAPAEVVV